MGPSVLRAAMRLHGLPNTPLLGYATGVWVIVFRLIAFLLSVSAVGFGCGALVAAYGGVRVQLRLLVFRPR